MAQEKSTLISNDGVEVTLTNDKIIFEKEQAGITWAVSEWPELRRFVNGIVYKAKRQGQKSKRPATVKI